VFCSTFPPPPPFQTTSVFTVSSCKHSRVPDICTGTNELWFLGAQLSLSSLMSSTSPSHLSESDELLRRRTMFVRRSVRFRTSYTYMSVGDFLEACREVNGNSTYYLCIGGLEETVRAQLGPAPIDSIATSGVAVRRNTRLAILKRATLSRAGRFILCESSVANVLVLDLGLNCCAHSESQEEDGGRGKMHFWRSFEGMSTQTVAR
jgi:hypothetical protein